jgi:hypothetical protein
VLRLSFTIARPVVIENAAELGPPLEVHA